MGLIRTNLILDRTVARLVGFLRENGVEGVLLKGQGVARYYRKAQMRQSGDIDFYVGKGSYGRAMELCAGVLNEDRRHAHETEQHYVFYTGGVEVELHRVAAELGRGRKAREFERWIEEELEGPGARRGLMLGDTEVWLPSYEFDALYVFYHAWHHLVTGGIGLRQLSDWAMIMHYHGEDIDRERLEENVRRFGLTQGWKLFAYIAVEYLGVAREKMPMYDGCYARKYERVMEDIVTGGNFGYHSEAGLRIRSFKYGWRDELGKVRSITEYFISLFPLIPAEATKIYLNRLSEGVLSSVRRKLRRRRRKK